MPHGTRRALAGQASSLLVEEQFIDTNGTALQSHTVGPVNRTGNGWVIDGGSLDIQSGRARAVSNFSSAHIDTKTNEYTITATVRFTNSISNARVVFRLIDAARYHSAQIDGSTGKFQFDASNAAGETVTIGALSLNTDYVIQVQVRGATATATINGGNQIKMVRDTYMSYQRGTGVGVWGLNGGNVLFDNLRVETDRILVDPSLSTIDPMTDLVSFWPLNEESGTRADAHGDNDLSDSGTNTTPGNLLDVLHIYDRAAFYTDGQRQVLTKAWSHNLNPGSGSWTLAWWGRAIQPGGGWKNYLHGPGLRSVSGTSFWSGISFTAEIPMGIFNASGGYVYSHGSAVTSDQWFFAVGVYDAAAQRFYAGRNAIDFYDQINPWSTGTKNLEDTFRIGSLETNDFNGWIGPTMFWKRALNQATIEWLYNAGAGRTYADMAAYTP